MKKSVILILALCLSKVLFSQNVGIGTATPAKGRLEVFGALNGGTVASFGTDGTGISIQRNWPTIGFNQYRDSLGVARYMGAGKASWLYYEPTAGTFGWDVYNTAGTADQSITAAGTRALTILGNGNIGIRTTALPDASLWVSKTSTNLAAVTITGTTYSTQFLFGTTQDVYLRGGIDNAKVIINDIPNGKILAFGKVALGNYPTNSHVPVTAAEIWGGLALSNSYTVDVQLGQWISNPSLSGYVKVVNPSSNSAIRLDIANGQTDGQILVIEGNQNPFTILGQGAFGNGNVYGSDMVIGGGDVVTFIWNSTRAKWMRMAYADN